VGVVGRLVENVDEGIGAACPGEPQSRPGRLPSMRTLSALLLLLVLPGLLLPAGFVLHVCRCARAADGTAAAPTRSCCAAHAATNPPAEATSCCARARAGKSVDAALRGSHASRDDCACLWIKAPEHKPAPAPLGKGLDARFEALPVGSPTAVLMLADGGHRCRWHRAESRPPPPDRHRNLPLLL